MLPDLHRFGAPSPRLRSQRDVSGLKKLLGEHSRRSAELALHVLDVAAMHTRMAWGTERDQVFF